jgi:FtsP/CotA-like multicopper oxidase with cupredoxin domain
MAGRLKEMNKYSKISAQLAAVPLLLGLGIAPADAGISGVTGPDFTLWARSATVVLGDGNSLVTWGYSSSASGGMQYPGPTLIVNQGQTVTVTLRNGLLVPVSAVFPGQSGVTAGPCAGSPAAASSPGLLTLEATRAAALNGAGGCVRYQFVAGRPGTYMYQSGTRPELEIEMGLVGTLIVRPTGFAEGTHASHPLRIAYDNVGAGGNQPTHYDREYLLFLTEMDRAAHEAVDLRQQAVAGNALYTGFDDVRIDDPLSTLHVPGAQIAPATYNATLWFLNGRNGPDTLLQAKVAWMPTQPYNALLRAHAGERVLMRLVGAGRDLHPFHHHGNNAWMIARDGHVLESAPGASAAYPDYRGIPEFDPATTSPVSKVGPVTQATLPDQSISNFTIQVVPGSTYDAIFTWTGKGLNWDIYGSIEGHTADLGACAGNAAAREASRLPGEDPGSHCQKFPVVLPEQQSLTFGGFWSGSPFLGTAEPIPPLQGGLNPGAGYSYMWHSHTERELTNDDVFPGGMMTMFIIEREPDAGAGDTICPDGSFGLTCPTP